MLGKSKGDETNYNRESSSVQQMPRSAVASSAPPQVSSISSGLSIIGKIVGHGALTIFGQMEGDVVAEELTIGGYVKGTIHANRVKLNSTAVVEGDIFHRTLTIEENARFEGTSRRQENTTDTLSREPHPRVVPIEDTRKGNGASDGLSA